jgi:chromosome segregation ATPase
MDRQVKIKVWHLLLALAIVFFAAGIGGESIGAKQIQKEVEKLKFKADSLQSDNLLLKEELNALNRRIGALKSKENNYYDEYIREYRKRIGLQKQNDALLDSIFGYKHLDSLAESYKFKSR